MAGNTKILKGSYQKHNHDKQIVYEILRKTPIGGVVTYKKLEEILGYKVDGNSSMNFILQAAEAWTLTKDGVVFQTITGIGKKRCNDPEIIEKQETHRRRAKRILQKAGKEVEGIQDFEKLPKTAQVKCGSIATAFGVGVFVLDTKSIKKLGTKAEEAKENGYRIAINKALEHFKNN